MQSPIVASPVRTSVTSAATFVMSAAYVVIAASLVRLAERIVPGFSSPLISALVAVLLLAGGLLAIASVRVPGLRPSSAIGFVRRPSVPRELALGGGLGWAVGICLVLPAALALQMRSVVVLDGFHLGEATASTLLLLLFVLGKQLVFCGLPFRSLAQATSPFFASVVFPLIAAILAVTSEGADAGRAVLTAMVQLLLCAAAARTRAVWFGTALQFLWGWSITVLFGLPSFLWPSAPGLVHTAMRGQRWATGGVLGPEAALWAGVVVLLALVATWRLTRDYAWQYAFDPIVAGGYPMDVPPPEQHVRMEQQAATRPSELVQIEGFRSPPFSADAVSDRPEE